MKHLFLSGSLCLFILSLLACSSSPTASTSGSWNSSSSVSGSSSNSSSIKSALQAQYQQWRGVPYRLGGMSSSGVDCSGFIQLTFRDRFSMHLPRTTLQQIKSGVAVPRSALQLRDLVFFKTSKKVRHVGIYMGDGQFLHASTSRGVMISSLTNPYWQSAYLAARRI